MTRLFHFNAPPGGLDSNAQVFGEAESNASASPLDERSFSFRQVGSRYLVVEYDGPAADQAIINAVEGVYGVSHRRTVEVS